MIIPTVAVIALLIALSVKSGDESIKGGKNQTVSAPCPSRSGDESIKGKNQTVSAPCPSLWIECGTKCFYFSEDVGNWTFSQSSCMKLGAELARFDNMEELNLLKNKTETFQHWIGLQRESRQHSWRWTDNTDYNNLYVFRPLFLLLYSCVVM
ncbi:hypothetical protein A6R68_20043, partial [Neotoma lepida]